jgi:hypothetical protein
VGPALSPNAAAGSKIINQLTSHRPGQRQAHGAVGSTRSDEMARDGMNHGRHSRPRSAGRSNDRLHTRTRV